MILTCPDLLGFFLGDLSSIYIYLWDVTNHKALARILSPHCVVRLFALGGIAIALVGSYLGIRPRVVVHVTVI